MITCPKCSRQLPDWSRTCQFCQTDVQKIARPVAAAKDSRPLVSTPKWIWPAYYAVSVYFLVSGLYVAISSIVLMNAKQHNAELQIAQTFTTIKLIVAAITVIIGIGLLAKIEVIRGIVNIFCWLQIAAGLLGLLGALMGGLVLGPGALVGLVFNLFDIATAGLMIFLIGETD